MQYKPINSAVEPRPSSSWWSFLRLHWENAEALRRKVEDIIPEPLDLPQWFLQVGHGLNASPGKCAGGIWNKCSSWLRGTMVLLLAPIWFTRASMSGPVSNHSVEELDLRFMFTALKEWRYQNNLIWKMKVSWNTHIQKLKEKPKTTQIRQIAACCNFKMLCPVKMLAILDNLKQSLSINLR